jgi:hypothetical protein
VRQEVKVKVVKVVAWLSVSHVSFKGDGRGWARVSGTVSGTASGRSSIKIIAMFRTVAVLVFCVYLSGVA